MKYILKFVGVKGPNIYSLLSNGSERTHTHTYSNSEMEREMGQNTDNGWIWVNTQVFLSTILFLELFFTFEILSTEEVIRKTLAMSREAISHLDVWEEASIFAKQLCKLLELLFEFLYSFC